MRKMEERTCKHCNKAFMSRTESRTVYCSRQCSGLAHSIIKHGCYHCDNPVKNNRCEFCSRECAIQARHKKTVVRINCVVCGKVFDRHKCHLREYNFCSCKCNGQWQSACLAGKNSPHYYPIGTVAYRTLNGRVRAWIKVGNKKWILRAHHNLNSHGVAVPKNKVIHHRDKDALNDSIANLEILTRAEHINKHRNDLY